jgi:hypothetical protein
MLEILCAISRFASESPKRLGLIIPDDCAGIGYISGKSNCVVNFGGCCV